MVGFCCRERTGTCLQIFKTVDIKKNKIVGMNVALLFAFLFIQFLPIMSFETILNKLLKQRIELNIVAATSFL